MAEDHMSQSTLSRTRTQAWAQTPDPSPATTEAETQPLSVLALGLCAWLATAGYTWVSLPTNAWSVALALTALTLLATGTWALRTHAVQNARWLLLSAFPVALACTLLPHEARLVAATHTALTLPLSLGCVLLYEALALSACRQYGASVHVRARPMEGQAVPATSTQDAWPRRIMLGLMIAGAAAAAVVAPLWPSYETLRSAWGPATADAGAVLTAVVGGAIGTAVCGLFLGSLLRRTPEPQALPPHELRLRVATALFLALLGAIVYFTIMP
jgi:hypothetical protein